MTPCECLDAEVSIARFTHRSRLAGQRAIAPNSTAVARVHGDIVERICQTPLSAWCPVETGSGRVSAKISHASSELLSAYKSFSARFAASHESQRATRAIQ
jgi:hypothetical protein